MVGLKQSAIIALLSAAGLRACAARVPGTHTAMNTTEKPVKSPCVSICSLNGRCFRNGHEIGNWGSYSNDERRAVLERTVERSRVNNPFLT